MARERRKLTAVDDPLEASAPAARPATGRRRREAAPDSRALYVRLPVDRFDRLDRAAFELRAQKRELVAALVDRYVDTRPEGLEALRAVLEEYRGHGGR